MKSTKVHFEKTHIQGMCLSSLSSIVKHNPYTEEEIADAIYNDQVERNKGIGGYDPDRDHIKNMVHEVILPYLLQYKLIEQDNDGTYVLTYNGRYGGEEYSKLLQLGPLSRDTREEITQRIHRVVDIIFTEMTEDI